MNSSDLNYFRVVVQEGSLNKASTKLFVSRQGLTKIMHRLEDELGEKLFELSENGIILTKFGEYLYENSEKYIQFHQEFLRDLNESKMNTSEILTIGIQEGFSEGFGKDFIANFIIQNKNLHIRVHSFNKTDIQQAMAQNGIQVWIMTGSFDSAKYQPIYQTKTEMFLLVSSHHPLAKKKKISMQDIKPYSLISLSNDIGQKARTNNYINDNTLKTPDYLLNASDRNLIMKLVQSGLAVSFNAGWHYREYPGIIAIPLSDLSVTIDVNILVANTIHQSVALKKFKNYVKETLG